MKNYNEIGMINLAYYLKELNLIPSDRVVCPQYNELKKRSLLTVDNEEEVELPLINLIDGIYDCALNRKAGSYE